MKKLLLLITISSLHISIIAQNRVGIGTANPEAQLHTTGDVMLAGVTNDNNLTRIVVQNVSGTLAWRDAGSLGNFYWGLTGNIGTTGNNFIGTTDNVPLIIKTNNAQRVQINTSSINSSLIGGVVDINVDSLKVNGCGLGIYRKGNVNGWGSSVEFQLNNSAGQKKFYARINGGIESNMANSENGVISFEVATNGQLGVNRQQIKMVINSNGFVGIGELLPNAQLHTTGTVRFAGLTNNDSYNRILVQDNSGLLFWRNASSILSSSSWGLNGNGGTSANNFIGTTDNNELIVKTNNSTRLQVNTESVNNNTIGGVVDINVDSLKVNGCGLGIYRKGNVNGWASSLEFQLNNSAGQKKFYARINGGIESNQANVENGIISFEVATNGQLGVNTEQIKMVINSSGNVGIGTLTPSAQLHTTSTVRFQNLSEGLGNYLLIDNDGNVYRSAQVAPRPTVSANDDRLSTMQSAIEKLQSEITALKNELKKVNYQ